MPTKIVQKQQVRPCYSSDAASKRAGWALAHPEFGSSVNPITTRGADYAHHITACPPGFENPAASLYNVKTCRQINEAVILYTSSRSFACLQVSRQQSQKKKGTSNGF